MRSTTRSLYGMHYLKRAQSNGDCGLEGNHRVEIILAQSKAARPRTNELEDYSVSMLRQLCAEKDLETDGSREDLIKQLKAQTVNSG